VLALCGCWLFPGLSPVLRWLHCLCTFAGSSLVLPWHFPGAVLAGYLCLLWTGAALAVYFCSLGSWLPLICWAGPWPYLGFALAPRWRDSDFWPTLFCRLLGFTLTPYWLDFGFWLTLSPTLILAGWSLVLAPAFCGRSTCSGRLAMLFGGLLLWHGLCAHWLDLA
jgi:hypothetical protein